MEMNSTLEIYAQCKSVPDYARKPISSGRMQGKTDISPMWRIEKLTEMFGPCGIGWWYEITSQRIEEGANGEKKAFVDINLYYKWGGETSRPIPGIGGNTFIAKETKGLYTDDECFKKALSDAISVAAKALGVGAEIYMGCEATKYSAQESALKPLPQQGAPAPAPQEKPQQQANTAPKRQAPPPPDITPAAGESPDGQYICDLCRQQIRGTRKKDGTVWTPEMISHWSIAEFDGKQLCLDCAQKEMERGR